MLPKNKKQVLTAILQAHSDNKGWTDISDIEELIDEDFSMFNVASIDMFGHYKEIDLSPAQLAGIYYHTVNNPVGYDYAMDRYNTFLQIAKQRALEEPETIDLKAEDNDNIEIIEKDFSSHSSALLSIFVWQARRTPRVCVCRCRHVPISRCPKCVLIITAATSNSPIW